MRALVFLRLSTIILAAASCLALAHGVAGRASATAVASQQNPNTAPIVATSLTGDFNRDCAVNGTDLQLFARHYLTGIGSLLYSPQFDLNLDGVINLLDLQIFAAHFTTHC